MPLFVNTDLDNHMKPVVSLRLAKDPATDSCFIQHPLPLGFLRLSLEGVTAAGPLPSSVYVEVLIGCSVWKSAIAKVSSYSRQVEWVEGNVTDLEAGAGLIDMFITPLVGVEMEASP